MAILEKQYVFKSACKRFVVAAFDFLGHLLFLFPKLLLPQTHPEKARKILLIRIDQIGDVLLAAPAFDAVLSQFKDAQVDLLVSKQTAELFEGDERIHKVYSFEANWFSGKKPLEMLREAESLKKQFKSEKYEMGIDFRGDLRTILLMFLSGVRYRIAYGITGGRFLLNQCIPHMNEKHEALLNLELLKPLGISEHVQSNGLHMSEQDEHSFTKKYPLLTSPDARLIVVHPFAGRKEKEWGLEHFAKLIWELTTLDSVQIVMIGTSEDLKRWPLRESYPDKVHNLIGELTLKELAILLKQTDLFIGHDSGPAHLAAFQGAYVVSLFKGPNDPERWRPWTSRLTYFIEAQLQSPDQIISRCLSLSRDLISEGKSA